MLDVSRIIGSKIRLVLAPVDLATLVTETIEAIRPVIDKAEIVVAFDVSYPVDRVVGDSDRLRQVVRTSSADGSTSPAGRGRRDRAPARRGPSAAKSSLCTSTATPLA